MVLTCFIVFSLPFSFTVGHLSPCSRGHRPGLSPLRHALEHQSRRRHRARWHASGSLPHGKEGAGVRAERAAEQRCDGHRSQGQYQSHVIGRFFFVILEMNHIWSVQRPQEGHTCFYLLSFSFTKTEQVIFLVGFCLRNL